MYDFLIIGHGLAGSLLSQELLDRGKKVLVIDGEKGNGASRVAAGIYNPLTGRKMGKTWMADQLFPNIQHFYSDLEKKLKMKFLYNTGIYRPFFSIEQQNDWNAKPSDGYEIHIDKVFNQPHPSRRFKDEFGGIYLNNAGYLDTKTFLDAHKRFLINKGSYQKMVFHRSQLKIESESCFYNGIAFKRLVFCLGVGQHSSPYFDWLPFRPVKGEVLDCELDIEIETIVNRGVFMAPRENGKFKVGATYDWKNLDENTTVSGELELIEKLRALFLGNYKVKGAEAGIRPATKDRRPFIGQHPKFEQMYVFNGFGSKGVSMIPYFSKRFADCLEFGGSIETDVNISRYFSLHYHE